MKHSIRILALTCGIAYLITLGCKDSTRSVEPVSKGMAPEGRASRITEVSPPKETPKGVWVFDGYEEMPVGIKESPYWESFNASIRKKDIRLDEDGGGHFFGAPGHWSKSKSGYTFAFDDQKCYWGLLIRGFREPSAVDFTYEEKAGAIGVLSLNKDGKSRKVWRFKRKAI